jgi:ferric-dicitrate binding protein FerR (iron transport regulator)
MAMRRVLALLIFATLILPVPVLPVAAQTPMGEVAQAEGPGRLIRNDGAADLAPGQPLAQGDRVLTGPNALALLLLTPETRIHLGPDSALTLDAELAAIGGTLTLAGAMVLDRPEGAAPVAVTVSTAFGEIGVRGTRFFAGPSQDVFAVFVDRGSVTVTAAGVSVPVAAGQGVELVEGQPPTTPAPWGAARIAEALALVGLAR